MFIQQPGAFETISFDRGDTKKDFQSQICEKFSKARANAKDAVKHFKQDEAVLESLPKVQDIERLEPADKLEYLKLVGKLSVYSVIPKSAVSDADFETRFIHEVVGFSERFKTNSEVLEMLDKLVDFGAFYIEILTDTNVTGSELDMARGFYSRIKGGYSSNTTETSALLNPFDLTPGGELFKLSPDKRSLVSLKITAVSAGSDDLVEFENGEKIALKELNTKLVSAQYMLRDGRNYFGDVNRLADRDFEPGTTVTIEDNHPIRPKQMQVVWMGTNVRDLEERYGKAYLPIAKNLIEVKMLIDGAETMVPRSTFQIVGA